MDVQALAMSPTPHSLRALVFFQAWDSVAAMLEEQPQWGRRGKAAKKSEGRVLPPTLGLEGNGPRGLPTSAFRTRAARPRPVARPLTCVCRCCPPGPPFSGGRQKVRSRTKEKLCVARADLTALARRRPAERLQPRRHPRRHERRSGLNITMQNGYLVNFCHREWLQLGTAFGAAL